MSDRTDNVIDSIESPQTTGRAIPPEVLSAPVVLGYIAGNDWLTYDPYRAARPELAAKNLVIPVSLTYAIPKGTKYGMYDIEAGGGVVENIGAFAAHVDRSVPFYLYTFASNGQHMLDAAKAQGFKQGRDFYYYAAHANGKPHICAPDVCGYPRADATQYLFAGSYDKGLWNNYALPHAPDPKPAADPYDLFPSNVGDPRFPNHGNERLTVEQADGALEQPEKFRNYLKGEVRANIKLYRDRAMRVACYDLSTGKRLSRCNWGDSRHLGARWQALNERMKRIDAIK